jgi:hypothetical protein
MLSVSLPPCCLISLSYNHGFWHYHNPPKNSNYTFAHITLSLLSWLQMLALCYSMSTCHMFHVTCYTNSLLSCIHIYTTYLLNITCTLVATSLILIRLECIHHSRRMYGIYLYMQLVGLKNTRILTNYAQKSSRAPASKKFLKFLRLIAYLFKRA